MVLSTAQESRNPDSLVSPWGSLMFNTDFFFFFSFGNINSLALKFAAVLQHCILKPGLGTQETSFCVARINLDVMGACQRWEHVRRSI